MKKKEGIWWAGGDLFAMLRRWFGCRGLTAQSPRQRRDPMEDAYCRDGCHEGMALRLRVVGCGLILGYAGNPTWQLAVGWPLISVFPESSKYHHHNY